MYWECKSVITVECQGRKNKRRSLGFLLLTKRCGAYTANSISFV